MSRKLISVIVCVMLLGTAGLVATGCPGVASDPAAATPAVEADNAVRNVIFFHPDGYGLSHWNALRFWLVGPDGRLNWDKLPYMAPYTGNMKDALTGSSCGGATVHAYGVKVPFFSFGMDGREVITALSGRQMSIMEEAIEAGFATALIQASCITHPGTAAFVASVKEGWAEMEEIAKQVIESAVDVMLAGGERWLLPEGVQGRHGTGRRTDGVNLIERARELGYTVVYNREELLEAAADPAVTRVLGVFACGHTYNAKPEEVLRAAGLPLYWPWAPTIYEMSSATLEILARNPRAQERGMFIVAEEEGTDDFPNMANARGSFEAGRRADQAFGVFADFIKDNPNTLLITTADSSAGGKDIVSAPPELMAHLLVDGKVPEIPSNSRPDGEWALVPVDGIDGAATAPFLSAPDRQGNRWPFGVAWATLHDLSGGILARAKGLNAEMITELGVVDNTDIYRIMYYTLFGEWLNERAKVEVPEAEPTTITILHTGDLHGRLDPFKPRRAEEYIGGIARIATLVNQIRAEQPNTIVLDGGDTIHGTNLANLFKGESVIAAMNAIGYDAMAVGNHDFNYGLDTLLERAEQADFPILGANVRYKIGGGHVRLLPPYTIVETGGLKIGIIGLVTTYTPFVTHPDNVKALEFLDPVTVAREMVEQIDPKVDLIVLLAHLGHDEEKRVLIEVPGIAVSVAATHEERFGKVGDVIAVASGVHGNVLGRLDIVVKDGTVIDFSHEFLPITPAIEKDASVEVVIAPYRDAVGERLAEVVGVAEVVLDGEREDIRSRETNLGNLVADVMRDLTGADITIQNAGGIRTSIDVGPITLDEIFTVLPFDNYVLAVELTGEAIRQALENGVSDISPSGAFPQVSGMSFIFDPARPCGQRIVEVTIGGEPLDLERTYIVAINCFLARGGDMYEMFKAARVVLETGEFIRDTVAAYIREKGTVRPEVEGRIAEVLGIGQSIINVDVVDETTGLPTRLGDEVTIEGVATVGTAVISTRNTIIFVQDDTGGIGLFAPGIAVEVRQGDRVRITGEVGHFNGLTQLQNTAIEVLSHDNPLPEPREILLSELTCFTTAEPLQGELVRVEAKIVSIPARPIGGAYNLSIADVTGHYSSTLRVGTGTGIDLGTLTVGGVYVITGIVGQFDRSEPHHDGYQIFPRSPADLVFSHIIGGPEFEPNLTVLLTGDLHGYLEPYVPAGGMVESGGMSRIAILVEEIRAEHPGVILLDAGDTLHGTPLAGFTEGEAVIAAMNAAGYQAMVVANHDFNFGQQVLEKRAEQADFPILGANVRYTDGTAVEFLPPYTIIEAGELRIGVIGLTCMRTPEKTHPANVQGLEFLDPATVGKEYARALKEDEGVDAIILMLHMGWDDKRAVVEAIDQAVPGVVAAAVSADWHRQHYEVLRGIPMISAGEHGESLARIDIWFEAGEVKERWGEFIAVTSEIAKCDKVEVILAPHIAYVEERLGEVIGEAAELLDGENVRRQETNLGNLIADAIREYVQAEIAIQNGGGIRASIDEGPITFGEIYTTLPFENYIVVLELTGEKLLAALENGVGRFPAGRFPHVSGMRYAFDPAGEPGERILEVEVGGEPLDLTKTYRVAMNCFMAAGGDGYVMFKGIESTITKTLLRDAVATYIRAIRDRGEMVRPLVEGRIIIGEKLVTR